MFDRRTLLIALSFLLLSSGMSLGFGCTDEGPARIEFRDASEGCNPTPDRLTQPIARGATLDVTVLVDGTEATLRAVVVDDPSVLGLDALDNPLALRALAPGQTRVTVTMRDGTTGALDLIVVEPVSASITPDPQTVWNLDTELNVRFGDATTGLMAPGLALLPDGQLVLRVVLRDAEGRALIGHGAAGWTATPERVTFEPVEPGRDDVRVRAGGAVGDVVLTTVAGGSFEVALVGEGGAASVAVYLPETGELGEAVTLAVGETRTVVLVAFDEAGHLLLGNGPEGFEAAIEPAGAPVAEVTAPPWGGEGEGDIPLDEAAFAFLSGARVAYVRGVGAGLTTLELSAAGRSATVNVVVSE